MVAAPTGRSRGRGDRGIVRRVDLDLDRRLERLGGRGHRALVVGVIRGGEREWRGWSAAGEAPDDETLFEIGSITKTFTAVLLADMALAGEVALDDPLSDHFPAPRPAWRGREPTLLELATHRSGLPNTPKGLTRELAYSLGLSSRDPWATITQDAYARLVARESPPRLPGGRVRYSSMAVGPLGDALAARAGRPYEELLADRVLAPLGMTATAVTVPSRRGARLLGGHSRRRSAPADRGAQARPPAACARAPATCCGSSRRVSIHRPGRPAPRSPSRSSRTRGRASGWRSGCAGWSPAGPAIRRSSGTTAAPGASAASPASPPPAVGRPSSCRTPPAAWIGSASGWSEARAGGAERSG